MALDTITQVWDDKFVGEMNTPNGTIKIGDAEDGMYPYHMFFGAIGSCFYSTFLSIAQKKRLSFEKATLEVSGYKETGKENNLIEQITMKLKIIGPSNEKGLMKSAELGTKFCSIHELLSKATNIDLIVDFE